MSSSDTCPNTSLKRQAGQDSESIKKRVKQTARMSVIPNAIRHPLVQRLIDDKIILLFQAQNLINYMKENKMDLDYEKELAYDDQNKLILTHSENCRTCCCCSQRTIDFIEMEESHFKCWTCADEDKNCEACVVLKEKIEAEEKEEEEEDSEDSENSI